MTRCLVCNGRDLETWTEAEDIEYHSVPERFTYRRCRDCGNLSIDPVPVGRLAEIYPPTYYSFAEPGDSFSQRIKQWLDQRAMRRLCASIPGGELSALDIGGGTGFMLDVLHSADPRVKNGTVIDIDSTAEMRARAAGHEFFLGEIERYPDGPAFDVILMINLIEHVADPGAVLRKAAGLLKPGGRILIKTPNYDSLDQRLFRHKSWGGFHWPRHWTLFKLPGFKALITACGLRDVESRYTQGAPFLSVSVIDWLQRKGVLAHRAEPLYRHPLNGPLMALFAAFDFLRAPFTKTSQMIFVLRRE